MKSVLITGGTGSFGQAFTKRLLTTGIGRIRILSRCEVRQHEMENSLGSDRRVRFLIGDVRDRDRLRIAMEDIEVVVHAAALKRVETGYNDPEEMTKTNVDGTRNVIWAAKEAKVKKAIFLSTDKAFRPLETNPYGLSKAISERNFLAANNTRGRTGPRFAATRYGNVFGSRGSVYPTWQSLLALGRWKDITISDPECTRFFMRMDQAIDLVLRAIDEMPAEVLIPVLSAFRLGDLADTMGIKHARSTGLQPYEKLHESMSEDQCSLTAPRMSVEELKAAINGSRTELSQTLKRAAG